MCKIAICDDDKEYREKIKTVIETEGILSSNEIRFYEYAGRPGKTAGRFDHISKIPRPVLQVLPDPDR